MKRDWLDDLMSRFVRKRANYTCQRCGKVYQSNHRGLHHAHVFSRGKQSLRFLPENALALCYGCHQYADNHKETVLYPLYIKLYGQEAFNKLQLRANLPGKNPDRVAVAMWLRQQLGE